MNILSKLRNLWLRGSRLSNDEIKLMVAIANGWTLKSHRYLDGEKVYKLWSPDGAEQEIPYRLVQSLLDKKQITTNQKFPAATFLLTTKGKEFLTTLDHNIQGIADIVHFDS